MKILITLNGEAQQFDVPANTPLLSLLRNSAGCFSVKHGCETGDCGACAVILDGKVVNACLLLAAQADQREIITLEGLNRSIHALGRSETPETSDESIAGRCSFQNPAAFSLEGPSDDATLHPIQQGFVDAHAIQCGYCTPGMILSAMALGVEKGLIEWPFAVRRKKQKAKPSPLTEADIRDALAGNLCRCTGYVKPVEAVMKALEKLSR